MTAAIGHGNPRAASRATVAMAQGEAECCIEIIETASHHLQEPVRSSPSSCRCGSLSSGRVTRQSLTGAGITTAKPLSTHLRSTRAKPTMQAVPQVLNVKLPLISVARRHHAAHHHALRPPNSKSPHSQPFCGSCTVTAQDCCCPMRQTRCRIRLHVAPPPPQQAIGGLHRPDLPVPVVPPPPIAAQAGTQQPSASS